MGKSKWDPHFWTKEFRDWMDSRRIFLDRMRLTDLSEKTGIAIATLNRRREKGDWTMEEFSSVMKALQAEDKEYLRFAKRM